MLVIADAHIGVTKPDKLLLLTQLLEKHKDEPVVWLGDAFDIVMIHDSYELYGYLIKNTDITISGNHDYGLFGTREYVNKDIYFTHGDLIDFGYIFGRLQQATNPTIIEFVISKLRKWSLNDLYNFYNACYELSDEDVSYFNMNKLKQTKNYFKLLYLIYKTAKKLLTYPIEQTSNLDILPSPSGSAYLGYFTHEPIEILKRVLLMYPNAASYSTIVVGHTHYPCDIQATYNNKTYRLVTLGAWIGTRGTSYGLLTDNMLEVINIQ